MKKNIYIIRHGESEANIGKISASVKDIKLTKKGRQQALKLLEKIENVTKIYVSKYLRTHETALPLANKHTNGKFTISKYIHEFTYINSGTDKTMNLEMLEKEIERFWKKLDPNYKIGEQSESFAEFVERLQTFTKQIKKLPNNTHIFSHKNFIITLLILLKNFPHKVDKKFNKKELQQFMQKLKKGRGTPIQNGEIINLKELIK